MLTPLRSVARAILPRALRNVLRAPRRALWWGAAELRHAAGLHERVTIREGFTIRCHPAAYPMAYFAQVVDPPQVAEFDAFVRSCTPGMYLFDLGAHFGLFSLAALHYGGPTARALAVDASPVAARIVRIQADLNGCAERLRVELVMIGDHVGTDAMVATGVVGAGYYVAADEDHRGEATATPMTTIDALAARYGDPTHLKIDVEGFEAAALRGGTALLRRARPMIFIELHHAMVREAGRDPGESLRLLRDLGYEVRDLDGGPTVAEVLLAQDLVRVVAVPAA